MWNIYFNYYTDIANYMIANICYISHYISVIVADPDIWHFERFYKSKRDIWRTKRWIGQKVAMIRVT